MNIEELIQRIEQAATDMQAPAIGDDPKERLATEAHVGRYILDNSQAVVSLLRGIPNEQVISTINEVLAERDAAIKRLEQTLNGYQVRHFPNNQDSPG